jgi:muramoyltetrapeptide carboxypeptidase
MLGISKGCLAGIVSPSAPISALCPRRLTRGVSYLKDSGCDVLLGKNVRAIYHFTSGTAQERADDLNSMFDNEDVAIIIITIGGYNANDVLDLLDYDLARRNNKKFLIGYSDSTVLLHALYKKSGVRAIMGPMLLPQFAEYPAMQKFSLDSFLEVVNNFDTNKKYIIPTADKYTEEMLLWDKDDNRPRVMQENKGWVIINGGKAKGRLMPANLNTLCRLIGTPHMPDLSESILFLEDDCDENASTIQRMLQHLKQAGLLRGVKGFVFGRFQKESNMGDDDLRLVLNNVFGTIDFPVVSNVDFGHTDPILSLPLGKNVVLDTEALKIEITL